MTDITVTHTEKEYNRLAIYPPESTKTWTDTIHVGCPVCVFYKNPLFYILSKIFNFIVPCIKDLVHSKQASTE